MPIFGRWLRVEAVVVRPSGEFSEQHEELLSLDQVWRVRRWDGPPGTLFIGVNGDRVITTDDFGTVAMWLQTHEGERLLSRAEYEPALPPFEDEE